MFHQGLAAFTLVFETVQLVSLAVPALHRKTEARATNRDVRPLASAAGLQKLRYSAAAGHHAPAAVGLFAQ